MNKKMKWGLIAVIVIGLAGLAIHAFVPRENKELSEAPSKAASPARSRTLNVIAETIKQSSISDGSNITALILPDEEVNLSFETSGKITSINFTEGTHVKKGQLLAKINDAQLQAQLRKLEVQLKLAEDRVFRQNALLEKEAVSKEAYEQVQTDLAMLKAEIDMVKANIAYTELRAPFDGVIGLRQVSEGAYTTPSTIVATLTKISPLKIEFAVAERYAGILKNGAFAVIMPAVAAIQLLIIYFGGEVFRCVPLPPAELLRCAVFALAVIPADTVRKCLRRIRKIRHGRQ